jgi:hypothetical protein
MAGVRIELFRYGLQLTAFTEKLTDYFITGKHRISTLSARVRAAPIWTTIRCP